jgi:hypothetical protein
VIAALASYFNVSPGYFFGEVDKGTLRLVGNLNDDERRIVHRIAINLLYGI